jgi:chromosome segregation ATPase
MSWETILTAIGTIIAWDFSKFLFLKLTRREKEADVKDKEASAKEKEANAKQEEIEVIRKIIDEVYKPTIEYQEKELGNLREKVTLQDKEIAELRGMVKDCTDSRSECHKMLATLKDEIARLQRSRDNRGRYAKEVRGGDNQS